MQRMKLKIKELKTTTNIFALAFICLNFFLTLHLFIKYGITNKLFLICVLVVEILVEIGTVLFVSKLSKKKSPIEKIFLALYIPLGLLFIIFMPHQQTPDSYAHLTRAYEISNGTLVAKSAENGINGAVLPVEIRHYIAENEGYKYELDNIGETLSGETYLEQEKYPSASGYNFVPYIPHAVGIIIGRMLHLPLFFILLLGRLVCMITFGVMAFFAIKLTPKFKIFLSFIALMPMTLQQTTSYTADAVTLGVAFLLFGYAMYLIFGNIKRISNKQILAIYALGVLIALCKVIYFPLVGLFILVPWKKFGSRKRKWINGGLVVVSAIFAEFLWMLVQPTSQGTVIFNEQFEFIINHPLKYIIYIFGTMTDYLSSFYFDSTFGMSLGAWKFDLPNIYLFLALFVTILVFIKYTEHGGINSASRWLSWLIFISTTIGFMTAMFTQWTKPGANYIDGVQGRYFIPILPLLPIMFSTSTKNKNDSLIKTTETVWPLLFNTFFCICGIVTIIVVISVR